MPYTSYTPYSYSNYRTSRPYGGSKSSAYDSSPSYLNTNKTPSSGNKFSESSYTTNNDAGDRKKQVPNFLSGNTASLRKAFGPAESANKSGDYDAYSYKSKNNESRQSPDRKYGLTPPKLSEKHEKTSAFTPWSNRLNYLSRVRIDEPPKPKEIDSSQINLRYKPPSSGKSPDNGRTDISSNESRDISRTRKPVRLTIRRNSEEEKKEPYEVRKNSIKTVAQKLLDKYTITDSKKTNTGQLCYGPRDRILFSNYRSSDRSNRYDKDAGDSVSTLQTEKREKDLARNNERLLAKYLGNEVAQNERSNDLTTSNDNSKNSDKHEKDMWAELEDSCSVFNRATEEAVTKKDIESANEMKDIVVAASLHPDIDLESDEEIKQLMNEDSPEESSNFKLPPVHGYTNKKSPTIKVSPSESNNRKSSSRRFKSIGDSIIDSPVQDGTNIVDKLKRFVKKQVSIKKASVKEGGEPMDSKPKEAEFTTNGDNDSNSLKINESSLNEEKVGSKSPMKLKEGMQKIKIRIALCDDIYQSKEDLSSKLSNVGNESKNNNYQLSSSATSACLRDAPWRKNRKQKKINKSKTSADLMSGFANDDRLEYKNLLDNSILRSPSVCNLDKTSEDELSTDEEGCTNTFYNTTNFYSNVKPSKKFVNDNEITQTNKFADALIDDSYKKQSQKENHNKNKKLSLEQKVSSESFCVDLTAPTLDKKDTSGFSPDRNSSRLSIQKESKVASKESKLDCPVSEIKNAIGCDSTDNDNVNTSIGKEEILPKNKKERHYNVICTYDVKEILAQSEKQVKQKAQTSLNKQINKDLNLVPERNTVEENGTDCKKSKSNEQNCTEKKVENFALESTKDFPKLNKEGTLGKEDGPKKLCTAGRGISNKLLEQKPKRKTFAYVVKEKEEKNEILNARNILKKTAVGNGGKALPKSDLGLEAKLHESNLKKVPAWKKSLASNESPSLTSANEIKQMKNVLKKPAIGTKQSVDAASISRTNKTSESSLAAPTKTDAPRVKKLWKRKTSEENKDADANSSDEENKAQWCTAKRRPNQDIKPPKSDEVKLIIPPTSSDLSANSRGVNEIPEDPKLSDKCFGKSAVSQEARDSDNLIGLSASKSADSAYGSSPSTPLNVASKSIESKALSFTPAEIKMTTDEKLAVTSEEDHVCGINCHKKCEMLVPNLCGVNQKLLAEALSSVKRESKGSFKVPNSLPHSSSSGTTTTGTSDDEDDSTTEESSESEFSGPAEIRSPLQSRPKFKKYTVDDFNFIKVLGKGSFGKVMLAQQIGTENYFAVKCLKKDVVLEDNDVECTLIERKVLTLGTKHPYLCHLFCSFQTKSHLFFVMEYLTGGDLMFHIQHSGRFDEYRACFYSAEICSGLRYLHNKGVIYRDLKLDNILLDFQGHIRIADFGMCKLQIYLDKFADTFCGTPDYMAPEVIKGQHYNQCVDWWSFGVLLYEMMIGKSPFKGCDEDHLFWLICNEEPFYPRFLTVQAKSILQQLLDKDCNKRLGIPFSPYGDIQCHPFYKYIDWSLIENKGMETPYKPKLRHILDVQFFDPLFTKRDAALTPIDETILSSMDQTPFKDFSYTNPNITD